MRAAVASLDPPDEIARALEEYFDMAAESMRNQPA
jgi:truncated hemoglobin YjbI